MQDIKFDSRNYRIHDDKNKELIAKSLDECGAGRSIVIDNDNEIIAGNGIYEAWGDRPVKVIETDGSELVVVKRIDLQRSDFKRDKLAIMDNTTSDSSRMDIPLLQVDFPDIGLLNEMGVEIPEIKEEKEPKDISDELKEEFEVVVECKSEEEQEEIFTKLTEMGLKCRLLTL